MAESLSSRPRIDTSDFKSGVASMNRELRILETSFRASAATMGDWTRTGTGLELRIRTLNEKIEIQKQKVEATRQEYERLKAENGEDARATQDMQVKLNQATESLNKMQFELEQDQLALAGFTRGSQAAAAAEYLLGTAGQIAATGGLAALKGMVFALKLECQMLARVIQGELAAAFLVLKVGVGAVLGLGAGALVAGALLGGLTLKAGAAADQLDELSVKTGISAQQLQLYAFVGKQVGTDLETITSANARLIRSMAGAEDGTGAQAHAFRTLGIQVKDSSGQLRDSNMVFGETLDALGKIQNPTERDALAMAIFGKNAQELNPLIEAGSAGISKFSGEAERLGAIVSGETIQSLGQLNDQVDALKMGAQGTGTTLLAAFAPLTGDLLKLAGNTLEQINGVMKANQGDLAGTIGGIASVLMTGFIQGVQTFLPQILSIGLTVISSLATAFVQGLPALLETGQQILQMLTTAILQALPAIQASAPGVILQLAMAILNALPLLFHVGAQILLTLVNVMGRVLPQLLPEMARVGTEIMDQLFQAAQTAFPILMKLAPLVIETLIGFLNTNLPQLLAIGLPLISQLVAAILPELPLLLQAALTILVALANGLAQQLPTLTPVLVMVLLEIVNVLARNAPLLVHAAAALIVGLLEGLRAAQPQIAAVAPELIEVLVRSLIAVAAQLLLAGTEFAIQVIKGWTAYFTVVIPTLIPKVASGILRTVAHSGETLMGIGRKIVDMIWQGIQNSWNNIVQGVEGLIGQLGVPGLGSSSGSTGTGGTTGAGRSSAGGGIKGASGSLTAAMASVQQQLATAAGGAVAGALPAGVPGSEQVGPFFAPVYIQGSMDEESLARRVADMIRARRF